MMNTVNLVGRLTKDVELRQTPGGINVTNITLAVNRNFTDSEGKQNADFISVVLWGKTAENLAKYNVKGSLISVTGRLQTRTYQNDAGNTVFVTEVVAENVDYLADPKSKQANTSQVNIEVNDAIFNVTESDLPF